MSNDQEKFRLWRRVKTGKKEPELSEMTGLNSLKQSNNVVFVLPNFVVIHDADGDVSAHGEIAENLLGCDPQDPNVDIVTISYPGFHYTTDVSRKTKDAIVKSQEFSDPCTEAFVKQYMIPLIDRGTKITLFGHSFGTVVIENLQRALAKSYRKTGMPEEKIAEKLRSVVVLSYGNVSPSHVLEDSEKAQTHHFTTIVVNNIADKVAENKNPKFKQLIPPEYLLPPDERPQGISLDMLNEDTLLMSMEMKDATFVQERDGSTRMFRNYGGHHPYLFTQRNDAVPPGAILAMERVMRNAVRGERPVKAADLVARETRPIGEKPARREIADHVTDSKAIWKALEDSGIPVTSPSSYVQRDYREFLAEQRAQQAKREK